MECHEGRRWGGSAAGSSCLLPASCRRRKWAVSCPEVWLQHPWFCSLFLLGQGLLKSGLSGSFSALPPCPSSASSEEVFRGQLGFSWRTPCCCWAVLLCDPTAEAGGKGIRRLFLPLWCTSWLLQDRLDAGCEAGPRAVGSSRTVGTVSRTPGLCSLRGGEAAPGCASTSVRWGYRQYRQYCGSHCMRYG